MAPAAHYQQAKQHNTSCLLLLLQFVGNTHNLVTASHDGTARVWDAWTGECLGTLIGHDGRLNAVSCSSDGRRIVTCSDDQTARVWETLDYTCIG
jgi:WD40 repeat protein